MSEQETQKQFSADMTVNDALNLHPEAAMVLAGYHLGGCSHCGVNEIETLEQVCNGYGIPIDALLASLNSLLEN
ncbi:MAG: DUF1858 domain-containing protein [Spirochaetia bacterium]|nr:DUF1858 domain-containing protein [Spirochaetia bacterium]